MRFENWEYPYFEDRKLSKYSWLVHHKGNFRLGKCTDIGAFTFINAEYGVTFEDYVQIGSHCSIYSVSTIDGKKGRVLLKRNCRIGSHSTIMPGVTIGENAIIGAHSFVASSVPDNMLAFGVPARVIRPVTRDRTS